MGRFRVNVTKVILFNICVAVAASVDEFYTDAGHFQFIGGKWVEVKPTEDKTTYGLESTIGAASKVNIKVYYETLCPGSIHFLTNQLRTAAEKLAPYLDIHLVPYGHAKTRETYNGYMFECQHGPTECYENKQHACAVDILRNETQAALFNACLMQYSTNRKDPGFDYHVVVNWCSYLLNLDTHGLWACVDGERSSTLLKTYGYETRAAGLRYIPYILINDSADKQDEATRDLTATVCRMLVPKPQACY